MMVGPVFVIEKDIFNDGVPEKIKEAATELGCRVVECKYVPFNRGLVLDSPVSDDACVICYGSINMMNWVNRNKPWVPGTWCNFDLLKCSEYYNHFGPHMLLQEYAMFPIGQLETRRDWIYRTFANFGQVFIRPDDNKKSFPGELVSFFNFDTFVKSLAYYNLDKSLMCLVGKPSDIFAEYRLVISNRKIISWSLYKLRGKHTCQNFIKKEILDSVQKILDSLEYEPHSIYVVDVAELLYDEPKIIEIGSVNCAGLYEMDIKPVVEEMIKNAKEEYREL